MGESFELVEKIITDSKLHFDCESGLVHVATQLGVKCFVVFGPTPIWYFGYEGNCNIGPKVCGECKGLLNDWYTHCIKYDSPKCMESITAQMVFEKIEDYLKNG
jgi:ADP-heptose:LPS heptosyltransferase